MNIIDRIEQQWLRYTQEMGREPKYVFLSQEDAHELDKARGMVVFKFRNMDVIIVDKRQGWVSVGDKYAEA